MRLDVVLAIICFIIGCSSSQKPGSSESGNRHTPAIAIKDTLHVFASSKNVSSDKAITITVSYAAIACGCSQWFEAKYQKVKFLEGVERFYLEPANKDLIHANVLWDGAHLPLIVKVTGRFSREKETPITYQIKGTPEKARIFWYDKITVIPQP